MGLHETLATCHPSLTRGQVWCRKCGATRKVNSGDCLRTSWPECCGQTMTIDSPEEQRRISTHNNDVSGGEPATGSPYTPQPGSRSSS